MRKIEIILIAAILVIGLAVRLYKIDRPVADWHSWRQADTAAVARNFIKEGYNPFIPRYDDMSSQANGLDNPNRYRFVEFPVYNSIIAAVWSITGINDAMARLVTVFITLGSTGLLYLVVRNFSDWQTATISAFFFAIIPYNVFYSSAILPGPLMVFFLLALYLSFVNWLKEQKLIFALFSVLFANLAILTWPIAIFFSLPLFYLAVDRFGKDILKKPSLFIIAFLSIVPFIAWRVWMSQFPEGIPNWQFLLNEGNIRFRGAFFRWLIVERLGGLILSVTGFAVFALGVLIKPKNKEKLFYHFWLGSLLLYFIVFASGNVRHDYYQVPAIPILAVFLAKGAGFLFKLPSEYFLQVVGKITAILLIIFTLAFGFFEVRGFYWVNNPAIIEAGKAVDKLIPKDATVIASYQGDAAFLYQTNRHGYPVVDRPLEQFIKEGTEYFASIDVDDEGIKSLSAHCDVVEKTEKYVILKLFTECIGK